MRYWSLAIVEEVFDAFRHGFPVEATCQADACRKDESGECGWTLVAPMTEKQISASLRAGVKYRMPAA